MQSHPLQAEPINHAYVYTFDQFHLPEDPDEHLRDGGLLLLAELNCTVCHAAPAAWRERLAPKPGPNLAGVGSRLDADTIWLMVRSPQHRKKGTQMPGLFAGEEGDAEKVEALTEFLSSLKHSVPPMPTGDAARGKELYHKVGCVACHEPASDVRPPKVPADMEVEKPGNASVPIALADAYEINALAAFLFNPLKQRPAGRMPAMRLTEQEAADLAAYLHIGRTSEMAQERAILKIPPQGVEQGRAFFTSMRCVACHETSEAPADASNASLSEAPPLITLKLDGGCLASRQRTGVPRFDLNELQRRSLRLALETVRGQNYTDLTAAQQADWQMTRLNCYACHDRENKGGPEDPRAQFFTTNEPGAAALGEYAHLPPNLDHVGRKLTKGWLEKILWGKDGGVRPYLDTRMPDFGRAQTEALITHFAEADEFQPIERPQASGAEMAQRAAAGRNLYGSQGLGCVACHGLKGDSSPGPPAAHLTQAVERLRPEYFKELLLKPDTLLLSPTKPPVFAGRPNAEQEIENLWAYLGQLDRLPLPEGLLGASDAEQNPADLTRSSLHRWKPKETVGHAIEVRFPNGTSAAFDIVQCAWTLLSSRASLQTHSLPLPPPGRVFQGYHLDEKGVPTFLYLEDGELVMDTVRPAGNGSHFVRTLKMNGKAKTEALPTQR